MAKEARLMARFEPEDEEWLTTQALMMGGIGRQAALKLLVSAARESGSNLMDLVTWLRAPKVEAVLPQYVTPGRADVEPRGFGGFTQEIATDLPAALNAVDVPGSGDVVPLHVTKRVPGKDYLAGGG